MATTTCEFILPKTWQGIPPDKDQDNWNFTEVECLTESSEKQIELIENATTGASFFLNKEITYGDFLIIVFLMLFLIFGIVRFFINFIMKKFYDN